jgi:hypothetical protein
MDEPEARTHSFIVKIWLEDIAGKTGHAIWRGHVTHVQSGARRYFDHLEFIADFVASYLEGMGAKLGRLRSLKRWLRGRRSSGAHWRERSGRGD